jgi:hypothetical protein
MKRSVRRVGYYDNQCYFRNTWIGLNWLRVESLYVALSYIGEVPVPNLYTKTGDFEAFPCSSSLPPVTLRNSIFKQEYNFLIRHISSIYHCHLSSVSSFTSVGTMRRGYLTKHTSNKHTACIMSQFCTSWAESGRNIPYLLTQLFE